MKGKKAEKAGECSEGRQRDCVRMGRKGVLNPYLSHFDHCIQLSRIEDETTKYLKHTKKYSQ